MARSAVAERRLIGRDGEIAELADVLASARSGLSGVMVMRGEAGVGKTALLDSVARSAGGLDVLRIVGIESEMELGFAALHQLLSRFMGRIGMLPQQQARALRTAFGLEEDASPDRFLVGLAALTLLSEAATQRGMLVVVDDAQWLDDESANVIAFVARRLHADRIGLLVAIRDIGESLATFDGLPTVTINALSEGASRELLRSSVGGGPFDEHVRTRILAEARGNPLALLELTRELSPAQLAGAKRLPEPLAIDGRLEARFLRQIRALPPDSQELLLVVAAEPTGDPTLVRRAGQQLDIDYEAILPAEAERLLSVGPPIRFRHPLIRSAIYQGAADAERRRAHAALAAATEVERDPDRRAWHLAAAAVEPDETTAAELERAADRARSRGGYSATASLLVRAAQLTPDPSRRAVRHLVAAEADLTAGNTTSAHATLSLALPDLDGALHARARLLEAGILFVNLAFLSDRQGAVVEPQSEMTSMMCDAAIALRPSDIHLAREAIVVAFSMALFLGSSSSTSVRDVAHAAKSLELPSDAEPTWFDLLLDALAELFTEGYRPAAPLLRAGLAAIQADPEVQELPRRIGIGCWAALALSDDHALGALASEWAAVTRDRGALLVLPEALYYLGLWELRVGSLSGADAYLDEHCELQALGGREVNGVACKLIVSAWRGVEAEVRHAASVLGAEARRLGLGLIVSRVEHAVTLLELGLGNYHAAALHPFDERAEELGLDAFRAADVIEAHVRGGDRDIAVAALEWLSGRALANRSALDLGLLARSRALLSDDSEAEAYFQEAITCLKLSGGLLHAARAQLLYGEWLRRQKRRVDARSLLTAALDTFESMGAQGFAERARVELRATGARARKRVDETRDDLTPQERQVAHLAAHGATNPEIAARLFISASTVDYHLRKVYRKLDIKSRRELGRTVLTAP